MAPASARRLEWSKTARRHLAEQIEYVALRGLADPNTVIDRVDRAAALIEHNPGIGTPGRKAGTREWPIKNSPLTMIYRVVKRKIQIITAVHQRQNALG